MGQKWGPLFDPLWANMANSDWPGWGFWPEGLKKGSKRDITFGSKRGSKMTLFGGYRQDFGENLEI